MVLELTQLQTEMNTRNLSWGKARLARKVDNLAAICDPIIWKMWNPWRRTNLCASTACSRDGLTFLFLLISYKSNSIGSENIILGKLGLSH
jgi:hypothetical protein